MPADSARVLSSLQQLHPKNFCMKAKALSQYIKWIGNAYTIFNDSAAALGSHYLLSSATCIVIGQSLTKDKRHGFKLFAPSPLLLRV